MSTAQEILARPPPRLLSPHHTLNVSNSQAVINIQLFHEWSGFKDLVRKTVDRLDLTSIIPHTDEAVDNGYIVGSELGLTGRFACHVCDPVARVLDSIDLRICFGDRQATRLGSSSVTPDVVILKREDPHNPRPVMVVELKTYSTVDLSWSPQFTLWENLVIHQSHIGQVVTQMRDCNSTFSALSTYEFTCFIRRENDCRFLISPPIPRCSREPSLRQCMLGIAVLASEESVYKEGPAFEPQMLRHSTGLQASTRPSNKRRFSAVSPSSEGTPEGQQFTVTTQSIIFGGPDGVATNSVEVLTRIKATEDKQIFEVMWDGRPAIAKCWTKIDDQRYINERAMYELLEDKNPKGCPCFAKFFTAGKVCCSSLFPTGNILVIEKVKGIRLDEVWARLAEEKKDVIFSRVSQGVQKLRACGIFWVDAGLHNILYHEDGPQLAITIVDFELLQLFEEEVQSPVELASIFGHEMVQRRTLTRYPGG